MNFIEYRISPHCIHGNNVYLGYKILCIYTYIGPFALSNESDILNCMYIVFIILTISIINMLIRLYCFTPYLDDSLNR